jgi:hypothetical protein
MTGWPRISGPASHGPFWGRIVSVRQSPTLTSFQRDRCPAVPLCRSRPGHVARTVNAEKAQEVAARKSGEKGGKWRIPLRAKWARSVRGAAGTVGDEVTSYCVPSKYTKPGTHPPCQLGTKRICKKGPKKKKSHLGVSLEASEGAADQ